MRRGMGEDGDPPPRDSSHDCSASANPPPYPTLIPTKSPHGTVHLAPNITPGADFTPEGAGLRPFSVANVEQPGRIARSPGDLTIRWTRRSRSLAADTWGAGDVPLAEDSEAYAVDILDGSVVKRSLTTATTSALYTAAQQTTDCGAPLGPGQSLAIRIYQLSALIDRGAGRSVTLTF